VIQKTIGYVTAGGQSLRMGRDKAQLPWGTGTLLSHAIDRLGRVCSEVRVLEGTRHLAPESVPGVRDLEPGLGPLGALWTALDDAFPQPVMLLAVDLPGIPVTLLQHLLERAPGFDAVVPFSPSGPEPLVAFYSASCLDPVARRIAAGERKVSSFFGDVALCAVGTRELEAFGDATTVFANLNTPEDLVRHSR
jgi:molybdopterin-guanine dinucleotide biosynthesis protein A